MTAIMKNMKKHEITRVLRSLVAEFLEFAECVVAIECRT